MDFEDYSRKAAVLLNNRAEYGKGSAAPTHSNIEILFFRSSRYLVSNYMMLLFLLQSRRWRSLTIIDEKICSDGDILNGTLNTRWKEKVM